MENTRIFASHALIREGTDLYVIHKYITLIMEINMDTGEIIDCCVPMYCRLHNDFVTRIIKGKNIIQVEDIMLELDERMHTLSKRSLITAIKGLYNQYTVEKKRQESANIKEA
ncbi:MAG: hypothetical protein H6Q75_1689 [Firmicutes bacterium]|nr:hypothetical protein [Bacillota bacterium]